MYAAGFSASSSDSERLPFRDFRLIRISSVSWTAGQYLDSEIAEFIEAWPLYPLIVEPIMIWLHLLHWLFQVGRRIDCCLDCPTPDKEDGGINWLLLFGSWRLDECLTCFRRISASGTERDAGSNAGTPESRGTSWEMIGSSCVVILACWMIRSNQR